MLFGKLLPFMALGLPFGLALTWLADASVLKRLFGAFLVVVSALELWRARRSSDVGAPLGRAAEVGFLGMIRDEATLQASTYANRMPEDLSGRQVFLLDPMLATGGTMAAAIRFAFDRGATDVVAICLLAAPEGVAAIESAFGPEAPVTVVVAGLDERLNDQGYIVPGLGDAGDRLYGVV